jgi:hypothetical protein
MVAVHDEAVHDEAVHDEVGQIIRSAALEREDIATGN